MDVNGKEASIRVQYVTILCKKSLQMIQCMSDLSEWIKLNYECFQTFRQTSLTDWINSDSFMNLTDRNTNDVIAEKMIVESVYGNHHQTKIYQ